MRITIISILIIFVVVLAVVTFSHIQEYARESYEGEKYCESLKVARWTANISAEGKYLLASIYAQGLCTSQDIPKAKDLFRKAYGSSDSQLGKILFYTGLDVIEFKRASPHSLNIANALFSESKSLGFVLTDKDREKIKERKLNVNF